MPFATMAGLKSFRVSLTVGGIVFVDADRFEWAGGMVRFYRGDSLIAEYPAGSVKEDIQEKTPTQRIGVFATPKGDDPSSGNRTP